jgi:hypothetical protein
VQLQLAAIRFRELLEGLFVGLRGARKRGVRHRLILASGVPLDGHLGETPTLAQTGRDPFLARRVSGRPSTASRPRKDTSDADNQTPQTL